jgi:8-oxo-dGTP pyrophosphatase MutT (NUDIX family)
MNLKAGALEQELSEQESAIPAAGGVVYRWAKDGQLEVLLIRKEGGFWTLPKGRIKPREDERDAVAREVSEETGITGPVEGLVRQVMYTIQKGGRHREKTVTYYLLRAEGGQLRPQSKERIARVRWFSVEEALKRIHRGRIREVVHDAQAMLEAGAADRSKESAG